MSKLRWAALLAGCISLSQAAAAAARLSGIYVSSDSVTLTLSAPVKYETAIYPAPTRLIVDLLGTTLGASKKINGAGIFLKQVRAGARKREALDVARVVLDLTSPVEYALAWDGPRLKIRLGKASPAAAEAPKALKPIAQSLELRLRLTDADGKPAEGVHPARFALIDLEGSEVWAETTTIISANGSSRAWLGRENALPADLDPACRLEIKPQAPGLAARAVPVHLKIGSFSTQANASRLQEELMGSFSQVTVVTTDIHGKTMFQVRVGPAESGIAAEILRRKLRTLGYQPALSEP